MPWRILGKLMGGTVWLKRDVRQNIKWGISSPQDKTNKAVLLERVWSSLEWVCARVPAAGRGLVWSEDTEMSYTNWETHDVAFSVLSPNSCFWVQSNSGLWKPGSCRNRTHGVICKQPRSKHTEAPLSQIKSVLSLKINVVEVTWAWWSICRSWHCDP